MHVAFDNRSFQQQPHRNARGRSLGQDPVTPMRQDPVSELKQAHREASLAQRERALAIYAADLADRSAQADARHAKEVELLQSQREELETMRDSLATREKDLAAKLRAAEEWENHLRARERALYRQGDRVSLLPLPEVPYAGSSLGRGGQQGALRGRSVASVRRRGASSRSTPAAAKKEAADPGDETVATATIAATVAAPPLEQEGVEDEAIEEAETVDEMDDAKADESLEADEDEEGWGAVEAEDMYDEGEEGSAGDEPEVEEEEEDGEDDWMAVREEATSHVYYWNRRTNETSWEPRGVPHEGIDQRRRFHASATHEEATAEEATLARARAALPLSSRHSAGDGLRELQTPSPADLAAVRQRRPLPSFDHGRRVVVVAPSEEAASGASPTSTRHSQDRRGGLPGRRSEPKWARESAALRDALTASRQSGVQPSQPLLDDANDGRVECPHCKRRFSEKAAERHIPLCDKHGMTKPRGV